MIKCIVSNNPFQAPVAAEAKIVPLLVSGYPPVRPVTLPTPVVQVFRPAEQRLAPLPKLPPRKTMVAQHTGGWISRITGHNLIDGKRLEFELPINTPRYTNGATLKAMLGGKSFELLLRKEGQIWEICENDSRIDLLDRTVEFRVGPVAVYS